MRKILVLAVGITWLGLMAHGAAAAAEPLPAGVFPLAGIDENLPVDDLAPLAGLVGRSRMVGLGESIHTSGGYLQAKFRLIKYLVEQQGFRGFLMETPLGQALATTNYVRDCSGSADDAMRGIFGVFAAKSTEALFRYLCDFNLHHPQDPVRFYGFDVQEPWYDYPTLKEYLFRVAPADAAAVLAGADQCVGASSRTAQEFYESPLGQLIMQQKKDPPAGPHAVCLASLARLQDYIADHKEALIRASSADEFFFRALSPSSLQAWENEIFTFNSNPSPSYEARDQGMAKVLLALWRTKLAEQKTVVWAHNFHLSLDAAARRTPGDEDFHPASMGAELARQLGPDFFPIGFVGYKVGINWPPYPSDLLGIPTSPNSAELALHQLGQPYLLLGPGNAALAPHHVYEMEQTTEVPFDQYRAMLYFDETPGMKYWNQP